MTIIAIFLFAVPFTAFCAVILVMGIADIWSKRESANRHADATPASHRDKVAIEKEFGNESMTEKQPKVFRRTFGVVRHWPTGDQVRQASCYSAC